MADNAKSATVLDQFLGCLLILKLAKVLIDIRIAPLIISKIDTIKGVIRVWLSVRGWN